MPSQYVRLLDARALGPNQASPVDKVVDLGAYRRLEIDPRVMTVGSSRLGLPDLGSLQCGADPSFLTFSNACGGEGATYPMACDRVALCSIEAASFYALPCS